MPLKTYHEKLLLIEAYLDEALDVMDMIPHDRVEKRFLARMETFAACLDDVAEQVSIVLNDLGPYEEPMRSTEQTVNPAVEMMDEKPSPITAIDVPCSVVQ